MKKRFLVLALAIGSFLLPGCSSENSSSGQQAETSETATTAASDSTQLLAYVCPMRCEGSGSNEPGKCKVCDMDLIANPDHKPHQDSVTAPATQ